jgi:hypothetical protein
MMSGHILNENKSLQLQQFMRDHLEEFLKPGENAHYPSPRTLYHYTSLFTLFDILESDSFWLSGIRFSNDASEEKILGQAWLDEQKYHGDNFILCLCSEGDSLSQWRGYCPAGGASIGLYTKGLRTHSVLNTDFDSVRKHKDVESVPVPVIYLFSKNSSDDEQDPRLAAHDIMRKIEKLIGTNSSKYPLLSETDFVPFLKHKAFHEEKEHRIVISNSNEELSKCIRFRKLKNGTKVPYIVIKNGCVEESHENSLNISDEKLQELAGNLRINTVPVVLPVCSNQNELYFEMKKYIDKKAPKGITRKPIICDGHLPIRHIKIAPMVDQKRTVEQVKRFCQSKYWLRDVRVYPSNIPYVPSINS